GAGERRGQAAPQRGRMNPSRLFILRPVATSLLMVAILLAGAAALGLLPVAPLPQVDFPTISVQAQLPGASPEVMAATVATPLERALGRIAGVTEITSSSSLGNSRITLQFDLDHDIDGAARVELNPMTLNKYAIGLDEVRAALAAANANRPKGSVDLEDRHWQIMADDQAKKASQYIPLIVAYRNGSAVRLSDVAEVVDSV